MIDFVRRNLTFLSVTVVTLVVIVGGIMLLSKEPSEGPEPSPVSSDILTPSDSYVTGGFKDGKFLPKSATAKVTLVEFGDYQCPACAAYDALTLQVLTEMSGEVNMYFRHFPLPQHKNAKITSYAAEAAGVQGKFFEMHHLLYEKQAEWSESSKVDDLILGYAESLKLDLPKFKEDLKSTKTKDKIEKDLDDGTKVGINSTPSFFINGKRITNPRSYEDFKKLIEEAKKSNPVIQSEGAEPYHTHFDIKTYINGVSINFAEKKYQSSSDNPLDPGIHFHDGEGKSVHIHKEGSTLKMLFDSFKLAFPADSGNKTLKVYVNGQVSTELLNYVPNDLDRILITYGSETGPALTTQLNSVTDVACIYSEKCPERGSAPSEECVGGVGTECEI
jgi:protein-disulfide isomerase